MGELKDLRKQQENLVERAREANRKLYLAGLGAYSKAEDQSSELLDKYVKTGSEKLGEKAEGKPRALLAGRGLVEAARDAVEQAPTKREELYNQFVRAGSEKRGEQAESTNEFVLAGLGAVITAREEGEKLFNDLVSAGEQRG